MNVSLGRSVVLVTVSAVLQLILILCLGSKVNVSLGRSVVLVIVSAVLQLILILCLGSKVNVSLGRSVVLVTVSAVLQLMPRLLGKDYLINTGCLHKNSKFKSPIFC